MLLQFHELSIDKCGSLRRLEIWENATESSGVEYWWTYN